MRSAQFVVLVSQKSSVNKPRAAQKKMKRSMHRGVVQIAMQANPEFQSWIPPLRGEIAVQIPNLNLKHARIATRSLLLGAFVR